MSLVSQLHSGVLGHWCNDVLTGVEPLIGEVWNAARNADPVRPVGEVDVDHWAAIGGAFGQRMCFTASHEPPYAAYFGAVHAGDLGAPAINAVHAAWPTHGHYVATSGVPASELRPTARGWVDVGAEGTSWTVPTDRGRNDEFLTVFTEWLVNYLAEHAPPGAIADTRAAEEDVARACWVLAGLENAYRGGAIPKGLASELRDLETLPLVGWPAYVDPAIRMVLLATPRLVVDELVRLTGRLQVSGSLARFRDLAGNPPAGHKLGLAQPTFVTRWAEGDVIYGDTLIDVKTVVSIRDRDRIARWLWQILGYAWLDVDDRYGIRNVGLYLARHGVDIVWPVEDLAAALLRGATVTRVRAARDEFLRYAHDAMQIEGAIPFAVSQGYRSA
jgi:hypothetical protein